MSALGLPESVSLRGVMETTEQANLPGVRDGITIETIRRMDELNRFADQWDCLAFDAPQCKAALSYSWVVSFLEHCLNPGEQWVCLVALARERLVGVLPLVVTPHRVFGLRHPRLSTPHDFQTASVDFECAVG